MATEIEPNAPLDIEAEVLRLCADAGVSFYTDPAGHLHAIGPEIAVQRLRPFLLLYRHGLGGGVPAAQPSH